MEMNRSQRQIVGFMIMLCANFLLDDTADDSLVKGYMRAMESAMKEKKP